MSIRTKLMALAALLLLTALPIFANGQQEEAAAAPVDPAELSGKITAYHVEIAQIKPVKLFSQPCEQFYGM